jgi:hypothetical protein
MPPWSERAAFLHGAVSSFEEKCGKPRQVYIDSFLKNLAVHHHDITHRAARLHARTTKLLFPPDRGGLLASASAWRAASSPAPLPYQHCHLSHHDVVWWRERNQRMRLGHDVAEAGSRFAADQRHAFAASPARGRNARTVWRAVADGRGGVRDCARVLIADAPCGFAADEDCSAGCAHEGGTVYGRIAESGCGTAHLILLLLGLDDALQAEMAILQNNHCITRINCAQTLQSGKDV